MNNNGPSQESRAIIHRQDGPIDQQMEQDGDTHQGKRSVYRILYSMPEPGEKKPKASDQEGHRPKFSDPVGNHDERTNANDDDQRESVNKRSYLFRTRSNHADDWTHNKGQ
jgi:hypothetical protein